MSDKELLLQMFAQMLYESGVEISFAARPHINTTLREELLAGQEREDANTLEAIATCLRKDTDEFACIDEIIALLESQGYQTTPRHDFG